MLDLGRRTYDINSVNRDLFQRFVKPMSKEIVPHFDYILNPF